MEASKSQRSRVSQAHSSFDSPRIAFHRTKIASACAGENIFLTLYVVRPGLRGRR